jgi:hypothetical protein
MKKLTVLIAAGVGYVLGTRAGRERYEQIKGAAQKIRNDPRVQEKTHQAAEVAREKAPVVKQKLVDAAGTAKDKVYSSSDVGDKLNPDSTHFQDEPYPKGDLP